MCVSAYWLGKHQVLWQGILRIDPYKDVLLEGIFLLWLLEVNFSKLLGDSISLYFLCQKCRIAKKSPMIIFLCR